MAYSQHPSTRGNTVLHRSATLGDPNPVVMALMNTSSLPRSISPGNRQDLRARPGSSPHSDGQRSGSGSGSRSRSLHSPGPAERSNLGRSVGVFSPVDTLRAGTLQGDDVIIPDYVDDEEWSWASRRRKCGGEGKEGPPDGVNKDGPGSGAPEGFVGWPVTDVNALNDAGETALHRAAGCRGEAAPAGKTGPGHSAGGGGGLAVMRHLLALGADPDARDARGLTPLMTILVKGKEHLWGSARG